MCSTFWGALLRHVTQSFVWRALLTLLICLPLVTAGHSLSTAATADAVARGGASSASVAASRHLQTGTRMLLVTSLADYGPTAAPIPGTLRYEVAQAEPGDTITFGIAGTIVLMRTI